MVILIHSSKTMKSVRANHVLSRPTLADRAVLLDGYLKKMSIEEISVVMEISPTLAAKTKVLIDSWHVASVEQSAAMDCFVGDIYSGFRAGLLPDDDREYADTHVRILSGLYGILRPFDGVMPYRLEMLYKLPGIGSLYDFWGRLISGTLPAEGIIVNCSSVEYTKAVLPFVDLARVVTPTFLTMDVKTEQPEQVTVHTKIARGAFARWLVVSRQTDPGQFENFNDLNYHYDKTASQPMKPVFVTKEFGGIGLSMRLR